MLDHDQLFKSLLMEFPEAFFDLFFPEWAARFDFSRIEWLPQEIFPDPPDGERRAIDLVAKLPVRALPGEASDADAPREWLALLHIELESGTGISAFRPRMLWYHVMLRQLRQLPVLPVAVFHQVGLDGIGEDEYVESFGPLEVIRFRYLYVGLPRLESLDYIDNPNPLAPGLVALMNVPEDHQAWLKVEAARRIVRGDTTPQQKHLLFSCLERYLVLSDAQAAEYDRVMREAEYSEVRAMAVTTFEKGLEQGRLETLRRTAVMLLEAKFGTLPPTVEERLEQRTADELEGFVRRIVRASSLDELGF